MFDVVALAGGKADRHRLEDARHAQARLVADYRFQWPDSITNQHTRPGQYVLIFG